MLLSEPFCFLYDFYFKQLIYLGLTSTKVSRTPEVAVVVYLVVMSMEEVQQGLERRSALRVITTPILLSMIRNNNEWSFILI